MNKKKILDMEDVVREKLTYDEIVNVREDVSELDIKRDNIPIIKFIAFSVTILAIVFGSFILFRVF